MLANPIGSGLFAASTRCQNQGAGNTTANRVYGGYHTSDLNPGAFQAFLGGICSQCERSVRATVAGVRIGAGGIHGGHDFYAIHNVGFQTGDGTGGGIGASMSCGGRVSLNIVRRLLDQPGVSLPRLSV